MDDETAGKTRAMIRRVVIHKIEDDGQSQMASMEVAENILREKVEVLQPYGLATSPPIDGASGIALSVAGDEGDAVILPIANPNKRMGALSEGDVCLYNAGGDKIWLRANGTLEIAIGGNATLDIPAGLTITTPTMLVKADMLECTGNIKDKNGTMQEMRDQYNAHGHPKAPNPPSPQMN